MGCNFYLVKLCLVKIKHNSLNCLLSISSKATVLQLPLLFTSYNCFYPCILNLEGHDKIEFCYFNHKRRGTFPDAGMNFFLRQCSKPPQKATVIKITFNKSKLSRVFISTTFCEGSHQF